MSDYLEIGKEIFERIPTSKRPYWGSLLLAELRQLPINEPKQISELRELINSNKWNRTHKQFSEIRNLTLKNSDKQKELYLLLAENIAKITYNQSDTNTPFDSDAGYWIYQLAVKLSQSSGSKEKENRIEGILKLFETEYHSKNYFAIETANSFDNLNDKIFNSKEEEFLQLRSELPLNCTLEDIKLINPKSIIYEGNEMWPNGSFEFHYDIEFEERKIGYYTLIWGPEMELMDEFYVLH